MEARAPWRLATLAAILLPLLIPAPSAAGLSYLALGDSHTRGTCDRGVGDCPSSLCGFGGGVSGLTGYPGRLATSLGCGIDAFAPPNCPQACCITNAGVPGEVTAQMITRIQSQAPHPSGTQGTYDVVFIMGGINDLFNSISTTTVKNNIAAIDTHAVNRDMDPVLSSIIRFRDDVFPPMSPQDVDVFILRSQLITLAGDRNRYFADPYPDLCPDAACFDLLYYQPGSPDPVGHPNGCGYDVMEDAFLAALPVSAPGTPPTTSPSGDITDATPTLSWTKASNTTWHQVQIDNGATWDELFQIADTACKNDSSCNETAPVLSAGSHSWRVRGRNARDYGNWSAARSFELFTSAPKTPTPMAPSGDFMAPNPPTSFEWSDESGAANGARSYDLKIDRDLVEVFNGTVAESCAGGTCSVAPPIPITPGDYTWQVLSENPAGQSAFSSALAFSYIESPPDTPLQIYPLGEETFDTTPAFRWDEAAGATEYKIEVRDAGLATVFDSGFVAAGTVCTSPCEMESGAVLDPEAHTWRVTAKNSVGESPPSPWADLTVLDCASFPDLNLPTQTVSGTATETACSTITAADGANTYTVQGPAGDVTFFAGSLIVIDNGFTVEAGAELSAGTDP